MSPEIISIIGILVGLAALIVLAMKGVSLYISAPLAAAVVAIFSGKNVIGLLTGEYMTGFAGFMQSYFVEDRGIGAEISGKISKIICCTVGWHYDRHSDVWRN